MTEEYSLLEPENVEGVGDEWEEIDVSDTEADKVQRQRDREFNEFRERLKNTEQFKVEQSVFDDATLAALYKLVQDGYVQAFGGPISSGKEANVYTALGSEERGEVAVKVYRINASDFRDMREYLVGDPRFEELGGNKKRVVLAWTRKEFANLKRARKAGVRVPEPIAVQRNVLVMEFLGSDGDRAPTLDDAHLENPETTFEVVREYMRRLYDAGLVHGDLSEYNIVVHDGELVIIDLGQAVTIHHPNSDDFLTRDCANVASFFQRQGMDVHGDELEEWIRENSDPDK
ncbi:serine protein kinase RIO [Halorussus gelatinilyticus]|uniref:non-specific serine/threonine protein kinase n=1 Tax=Halorussus gelatinilyticus TaxID=2937524 RepID=A0A8U0IK68_9EURY|nr:serine/threonine-protein kinase Rio1 [Halorussus gelatinilyticus]UPW01483.1 serine protein kinase RIO [Halorussus gelatinilyticus]